MVGIEKIFILSRLSSLKLVTKVWCTRKARNCTRKFVYMISVEHLVQFPVPLLILLRRSSWFILENGPNPVIQVCLCQNRLLARQPGFIVLIQMSCGHSSKTKSNTTDMQSALIRLFECSSIQTCQRFESRNRRSPWYLIAMRCYKAGYRA